MWEVLLGTAAANKAVSVGVGLSVLLGAAGTAEVTGVGPAVRDIVIPEATVPAEPSEEDTESEVELTVETIEEDDAELTTEEAESNEESEDADHPQDDREHAVVDAEDAPGNLVWHSSRGSFHLRGLLVEDGDGVAIRTAGPDGSTVDLPIDQGLVTERIPGAKSNKPQPDAEPTDGEPALADYIGYLVSASGECTAADGDDELKTDCTVNELHILGQAGQGDDDATSEDSEALESESDEESGADEDDESEEEADDDDGRGKPEHAGPKHDKPSQE